jgi:putative methyltransferase (TIGR04325 family)
MRVLKGTVRDWLPPIVVRWIGRICGMGIQFQGDFATWEEASAWCTGYDAGDILAKVLDATFKVKSGEATFERDSIIFDQIEYTWPLLSGLMWGAALNGGRLNVLDFGGALGSSYFQNRKFLQSLSEVHWNVVEQPHFVETGQKYIQDEQLRFYKTIEECLLENQPNVILLSSVLQYLKSPIDIINKISRVGATCLIIDRTPFSAKDNHKLMIQRVPPSIYAASYPMWVFSRQEFMNKLGDDWCVVAENLSPEGQFKSTSGLEFSFQGMLLEPRQ